MCSTCRCAPWLSPWQALGPRPSTGAETWWADKYAGTGLARMCVYTVYIYIYILYIIYVTYIYIIRYILIY